MESTIATLPSQTVSEKLDFRRILPIFVIVLVDLLGLTIIIPLMPLYATAFGAAPLLIGLLGASYPVMQFIGAPFLGRLSDRVGRKPVLLVSQMGTFIGFLILGFANSLWLLFLSRILDGLSGANISTAQAAISDSTTEKTRTQGLGLIGAAFGIGFILGPIIAFLSLSASGNNYHVPAFVAAGFSLISILLTWFWFEETLPQELRHAQAKKPPFTIRAMLEALRHPAVGFLLLLMFAQQIAFGGFEQLLALFTLNRLGLNASGNAILFVFVGLLVVAVQGGLIGRWSRKYGERKLILAGLAALAIGLTLTALTPRQPMPSYSKARLEQELRASGTFRTHENPTTQNLKIELPDDTHKGWLGLGWLLVAMVPAAIGGGILQPSINSLITQKARKDEVGGLLGISAAFLSGANAVAPLIGGVIFQALGSTAPFLAGGMLMAVLLAIAIARIRP
ncbi:MAG: MFS transporter [Anaerolineales bacterium]|nr:MFS transporter [Anaerolineales bacterium]MCS7249116.1 MFS transporter [Anaerolineales bacterium]MDW8162929.1 MFS transporter [Anaerolineales bacterium]MDW8446326.1 MFS transporter [Anaerolineales bacterium]